MQRRRPERGSLGEVGTVTAELAIAMPSVVLVIAVTLSGFGLQVERMKYVAVAASAARALGRGETESDVAKLVAESAPEARLTVDFLESHICATIAREVPVLGLQEFEVSERQCARKMGL
jgi:hypothetical protein